MARRHTSENSLAAVTVRKFNNSERNLNGTHISEKIRTWTKRANNLMKDMSVSDTKASNKILNLVPYRLRVLANIDDSPSTVIERRIGELEGLYLDLQNDISEIAKSCKDQLEKNALIDELANRLRNDSEDKEAYSQLEEIIRGTDQDYQANSEAEEAIEKARQKILETNGPQSLVDDLLEQADRTLRFNAPAIALADTAIVQAVKLSDGLKADRKLLTDTLPTLNSAHRGAQDILEAAKLNVTSDQFIVERMVDIAKGLEMASQAMIMARERRAANSDLNRQLSDFTNRAQLMLEAAIPQGAKRLAATTQSKPKEEDK